MSFSGVSVWVRSKMSSRSLCVCVCVCVCEFITRNWLIQLWELAKQTGSPQGRHSGEGLWGRESCTNPSNPPLPPSPFPLPLPPAHCCLESELREGLSPLCNFFNKALKFLIYLLLTFGCAGSLLLHVGFL